MTTGVWVSCPVECCDKWGRVVKTKRGCSTTTRPNGQARTEGSPIGTMVKQEQEQQCCRRMCSWAGRLSNGQMVVLWPRE